MSKYRKMIKTSTKLSLVILGTLVASSSNALSALANWPDGFYKASNNPKVYYLDKDKNFHCHVQNPSQMEIYGGFQQVRVVGNNEFMSGTNFIGKCGFPTGFYRRKSDRKVYGVNAPQGIACWVSSPQMMDAYGGFSRVKVVDDSSDILAQRRDIGSCVWPGK
jgi:hypothetical protein